MPESYSHKENSIGKLLVERHQKKFIKNKEVFCKKKKYFFGINHKKKEALGKRY